MTDRTAVSRWLADYETAWRAPGTDGLARIFAGDATYLHSPYEPPIGPVREHLLHDRVAAVLLLGLEHAERGVGEHAVVAPGAEQFVLAGGGRRVEVFDPADDQPGVMACPFFEVNAVWGTSAAPAWPGRATIALARCPLGSERGSISSSHRPSSEGTFRVVAPESTPIYAVD